MKATLSGRCRAGNHRIQVGSEIQRYAGGWAHVDCVKREREELAIIERCKARGLELGVWGIPDGADGTFTRDEFIRKASDRGLITANEASTLRVRWASILYRDLSD